jgi:M6 family metalloprotease-like protein
MLLLSNYLFTALINDIPMEISQPDGTVISCFASGDEFFNYYHDENGFTIIQAEDGFYYWAIEEAGNVIPSSYRVDLIQPESVNLRPFAKISLENYQKRKKEFFSGYDQNISRPPHIGEMNNIAIYIRFSNDTEFTTPRSVYDDDMNAQDEVSVYHYFNEVSYNQLEITSTHYPVSPLNTNISYQDSYPRSYYQAYNAYTNPDGYQNYTQRTLREHTLLMNAVAFVEDEIPTNLNIDGDGDNRVDNVCFIIRGSSGAWAELLWAHRWSLFSFDVRIHGKRVWDYTFQPETQCGISTLCHELFHTLGAPDLYRYETAGTPVGPWDLMSSGFVHMGAWMKYKYAQGNWINDIPVISGSGTFTLNPLTSPENNAYKILSPYSNTEFFIVEYRNGEGLYESNLPGTGLLVYRINSLYDGNADGPPDEVYIYRPNGTTTSDGSTNSANFGAHVGRTMINDDTNPSCFLSNGNPGGLFIHQVSEPGETISFILNPEYGLLSGYVNVDNPEIDLTNIEILFSDQVMNPGSNGYFIFSALQGEYPISATLPGYSNGFQMVTVEPFIETSIELNLSYLIPPVELNYTVEDNGTLSDVHLAWNFDNFDDEYFSYFDVYMKMGDYSFFNIGQTNETTFTRTVTTVMDYQFYIQAIYENGTSDISNIIDVSFTSGSENSVVEITKNKLENYPNPFNPVTTIHLQLKENLTNADFSIFNNKGQKVKTLASGDFSKGRQTFIWNGRDANQKPVASGIYFYKISSKEYNEAKKMILLQ